jgi:hypothetical protein
MKRRKKLMKLNLKKSKSGKTAGCAISLVIYLLALNANKPYIE